MAISELTLFSRQMDSQLNQSTEERLLVIELLHFLIRDVLPSYEFNKNFETTVKDISSKLCDEYVISILNRLFKLLVKHSEFEAFKFLDKELLKYLPKFQSKNLRKVYKSSAFQNKEFDKDSLRGHTGSAIVPSILPIHPDRDMTPPTNDQLLPDQFLFKLCDELSINYLKKFAVSGIGGIELNTVDNLIYSADQDSASQIMSVLQYWQKTSGNYGLGNMKPCTKIGLKKALQDSQLKYIIGKLGLD